MKSIMLASMNISLGISDSVICGGFEGMSKSPHMLINIRKGYKLGDRKIVDSLLQDGLKDAFSDNLMGNFADRTA